jgi:hypothetical protein
MWIALSYWLGRRQEMAVKTVPVAERPAAVVL